jgi:hypothetical protein
MDLEGLSNDNLSIDNGVIATKCERWPFLLTLKVKLTNGLKSMRKTTT